MTTIIASAQNPVNLDYDKFYKSFAEEVTYPPQLINDCLATVCLFKTEVTAQGNIKNMELSDSADSLFRTAFDKNKQHLDTAAFKNYIKANFKNPDSQVL